MAELVHACADGPPGTAGAPVIAAAERLKLTGAATLDLRHFTVVPPPHTAALNLLPPTPTAQPARHLTEQPVTLRHRTSPRLARRTTITHACCYPVPAHGGMQITVIRTAEPVAVTTDRIRICMICG